jgi:hypothetical protein
MPTTDEEGGGTPMKRPKIQFNPFADLEHLRFGQPASAALGERPPVVGEDESLVRHRAEETELAAELERRRAIVHLIDTGEEAARCEQRLALLGSSAELAERLEEAERAAHAGGFRVAFDKMRLAASVDRQRVVDELRRRHALAVELEERIELLRTQPQAVRGPEQIRIIALERRLEKNRARQQLKLEEAARADEK